MEAAGAAADTAAAEKREPREAAAGRAADVLSSPRVTTDPTGTAAAAGVRAQTGSRGARALLRGTHRTVLTVAAFTGVVLVAGVFVGLRGGGSGHGKAASPDPAATFLDPGSDGGTRAGVPGALPPSSGHRSGATPDSAAAGHTGHGDGKHAASGTAKGGSHASSGGSPSSSAHSGGSSAGHSTSSATHPAAQDTPASAAHTTAPAASGGSSGSSGSGVMVFSHASGRCLTVAGGQGKDGSPLEIRDCSGSSAQKWTFASDGTVRAFGLCMDAAGASTANGTVVQLAKCNGGPAQQFRLNVRQDLTSVLADKCVDVKDEQTANGTRLQLWSCAGTDNQKWSKK
ncbi:ricin-type beta-trefoil lectin domain protein [Streptomyces sp. NPDC001068]|uniref:ricin-type beta-trefoil lectin domain protein n=1 Tax=Streptomyces sp. NPDC001068 TaxID=3364544 RepID=UPI0036BB088E